MKRALSAVLIFIMLAVMLPQAAFADGGDIYVRFGTQTAADGLSFKTNAKSETLGLALEGAEYSTSYIDFDIDDGAVFEENKNYYVNVEYYNSGNGFFFLEYVNGDGESVVSDYAYCNNTNEYVQKSFLLKNPVFNYTKNKPDLRLRTSKSYTQYEEYSDDTVYIRELRLESDGTYSGVEINVTSENTGNIFFTGDDVKFTVTFENKFDAAISLDICYNIYSYTADGGRTRVDGLCSTDAAAVAPKTSEKRTLTAEVEKYGLYCLEVTAAGSCDGKTVSVSDETEFSKCVYNEKVNKSYGINSHASRALTDKGDAETLYSLMRSAGIGAVRECFNWEQYEPIKGKKQMYPGHTRVLKLMEKYGMEPYILIFGNNRAYESGDFVSPDNKENYQNYIRSLMSEPEMQRVKKVELYNEPDLKRNYLGNNLSGSEEAMKAKQGELYATMTSWAYEAIKSVRSDVDVSVMSICNIPEYKTRKVFLESAMDVFEEYKNETGTRPFDSISLHPYAWAYNIVTSPEEGYWGSSEGYRPEKYNLTQSVADMVRYCRNIINGFSYKDSDYGMAISEYGWSSANANLLGKKDCTVKQAALDLRSYMILKCADFDTVNYKYDFMDDGLRENGKEYNFGMINWSGHSTPYSAKEGYVAACAFNNMTNDAVALDEVYSKDYSKIMKFTYPTGSVYALWTVNSSASDSVEFDLGASPVFYDMYGNILDRESVIGADGKYLLTDIPFFAAVGKEITYAAHNGEDDENIKISGSISSGRENVRVSLTVLPSDAAFDSTMYGNIAYMNQTATRNNGEFDFVLNGLDRNSTYTAYVVAEDADIPLSFDFRGDSYPAEITLYDGSKEVNKYNIDSADLTNARVEADFRDGFADMQYCIIYALYKDGRLVDIKKSEGVRDKSTVSFDVSAEENPDYDTVKLMLWNSSKTLTPICKAKVMKR